MINEFNPLSKSGFINTEEDNLIVLKLSDKENLSMDAE